MKRIAVILLAVSLLLAVSTARAGTYEDLLREAQRLVDQRRLLEGLETLKVAARLAPERYEAYAVAAYVMQGMEQKEGAREALASALQKVPAIDRAKLDGLVTKVFPDGVPAPRPAGSGPGQSGAVGRPVSINLGSGISLDMMPIPAGKFIMGSPEDEDGRQNWETQVEVTISRPFFMGRTEVTQGQWLAIMGRTLLEQAEKHVPGKGSTRIGNTDTDYPIYWVTAGEAEAFCAKLNEMAKRQQKLPPGYQFRLPTSAEWEYACRAGTTTTIYTGALKILGTNNAPALDAISWYGGNSMVGYEGNGWSAKTLAETQYEANGRAGPRLVARKAPNAFGLYDMLGNVGEWCWDSSWQRTGAVVDPRHREGEKRVERGAAWFSHARNLRAAAEFVGSNPGSGHGFRVVLGTDWTSAPALANSSRPNATPAAADSADSVFGRKVEAIDFNNRTFKLEGEGERQFHVNDSSTIRKKGRPATIGELEVGDYVTVKFKVAPGGEPQVESLIVNGKKPGKAKSQ